MRIFGHAMPTGKLGAEGGVIPISAISQLMRRTTTWSFGSESGRPVPDSKFAQSRPPGKTK